MESIGVYTVSVCQVDESLAGPEQRLVYLRRVCSPRCAPSSLLRLCFRESVCKREEPQRDVDAGRGRAGGEVRSANRREKFVD